MFSIEKISRILVFEKWYDFLGIDEDDISFLDADLSGFKSLIKTLIILAFSALIVALVFVVFYGGFLWVTAGDKEEQLQKAKKVMKDGIMAIVIAFGFLLLLGIIAGILGVNITDFSYLDDLFGP